MKSTEVKIDNSSDIVLDKDKVSSFLEHYDLGQLIRFSVFEKGFANEVVYLETDTGEYILKIAIRNNPDRVKYEVGLLNFLNDLPIPEPVVSKNGKYLLDYGDNKAFIYRFLSGEQKEKFTEKMLSQVGAFLANFHLQSREFHSDIERIEFYNLDEETVREMAGKGKELENRQINKALPYLAKQSVKYLLPDDLSQGAIHIDVKPENLVFEEEELTGVVDFDNSYIGPLVLDLAKAMTWFCTKDKKFELDKARSIYDAYTRNRELNDLEKAKLPDAIHYSYVTHPLIDIDWLARGFLPDASYILWQLENMLPAEKNLEVSIEDFE